MSQNKQNKPEISVLMSVYAESADAITVAVESILNQSFSNFEFIIVNDNPARAETRRVLDTLSTKDDRIQVLTNDRNRGLGYALNAALQGLEATSLHVWTPRTSHFPSDLQNKFHI